MKLNLALIQMKGYEKKEKSIEVADKLLSEAAKQNAQMALLPAMFCCLHDPHGFYKYSEKEDGFLISSLRELAVKHELYLCGGSIPEEGEQGKVYNTSYVFDPKGNQIAKHRKVHLFDAEPKEGEEGFKESDNLTPGDKYTVFETEFGKMGLCICFDIRFPELFRLMALDGAQVILVPATFGMDTGPLHWDLLFRLRAIDNQVYMAGSSPATDEDAPHVFWGHSIISSPWGEIVGQLDGNEGVLVKTIELDAVKEIRKQFPLLKLLREDLYQLNYTGK